MDGATALVFEQLSHDFPRKAIKWVVGSAWAGPKLVPLKEIDYSAAHKWRAASEPDKVNKFVEHLSKGRMKPIIGVIGENNLVEVVDGHHRALAYKKLGRPALMYVGKPRDEETFRAALGMHSEQKQNPSKMTDAATPFDLEVALLDLGVSDVHVPGSAQKERSMAVLKAKKRNALPDSSFADPEGRKYPIHDKAHADNAASRIEQDTSYSSSKKAAVKARIHAAQKRFGEGKKRKMTRVSAKLGEGGSLHVRHMSEWAPCVMLAASNDDGPVWIQLAKPGTFRGHRQGAFSMTADTFREVIRNFNATANKRVPVDYEHASEQDPTSGSIPYGGAPAQGWIVDMALRGDELWGLVEWNDQAKQQIRAKEYMFFSPAIRFDAKDRVSGERIGAVMTSGALTNKPFLDGMMPLAARDDGAEFSATWDDEGRLVQLQTLASMAFNTREFMPKLRAVMKLGDMTTHAEVGEHVKRLASMLSAVGGDHEATYQGVSLSDFLKPMRDLVGARPGMTWADVFAIVDQHIAEAIHEHNEMYHADQVPEPPDSVPEGFESDYEADPIGGDGVPDMAMSDAEKAHLANLEEQNKTLTTKVNELTVACSAKDADIKTLSDERDQLKKSESERADREMSDRIEYTKKVHAKRLEALPGDDAAKTKLLTDLFTNSRPFFDAQYPVMQAEDKRGDLPRPALLLNTAPIVPPERKEDPSTVLVDVSKETWGQTVTRLMNDGETPDNKPMSYDAACHRARAIRRAAGLSIS